MLYRAIFPTYLALSALAAASPAAAQSSDDGWIFEAGVGIPKLSSGDVHLSGDLSVGYSGESLFVLASGALGYYDLARSDVRSDNLRATGSLAASYLTGERTSSLRFEANLASELAYYDGTEILVTRNQDFTDQTSLLLRGTLLGGVRLFEQGPLSLRVLAGGGVQLESYSQLRVGSTNSLADTDRLSFRPELRLSGRWALWEDVLALRLKVRGSRFELTRSELLLSFDPDRPLEVSTSASTSTQTEVSVRLYADLDVLRFGGFVPALFLGIELVRSELRGQATDVVVPIVGADLFRVANLL